MSIEEVDAAVVRATLPDGDLRHYKFDRSKSDRVRLYYTPDGTFPSVTSILEATSDKRWLDRWRKKVGIPEARRVAREAAIRGTTLHHLIAHRLKTGTEPIPPTVGDAYGAWGHYKSVESFIQKVSSALLVEGHVWHPLLGYAGEPDLLAVEDDGLLSLVDWKSSEKPKRWEWIENYRMQVAAYAAAVRRLYNLPVERGRIVVTLPHQEAQVFTMDLCDMEESWRSFQRRLEIYRL